MPLAWGDIKEGRHFSLTHTHTIHFTAFCHNKLKGHSPSENGSWGSHWCRQSSHWLRTDRKRQQRRRVKRGQDEDSFQACLLNVIPLSVCVCDQAELADWLTEESGGVRAGDCTPPSPHPLPYWDLKQYLVTANGTRGHWGPVWDVCVWCGGFLPSIRGPAQSSWATAVSSKLTTVPTASGGWLRPTVQLHHRTTAAATLGENTPVSVYLQPCQV